MQAHQGRCLGQADGSRRYVRCEAAMASASVKAALDGRTQLTEPLRTDLANLDNTASHVRNKVAFAGVRTKDAGY